MAELIAADTGQPAVLGQVDTNDGAFWTNKVAEAEATYRDGLTRERAATLSVMSDPSRFAKYKRVADITGADPMLMMQDKTTAEYLTRQAEVKRREHLELSSPYTAQLVNSDTGAIITQGDIPTLEEIEAKSVSLWTATPRALAGGVLQIETALAGAVELISKSVDQLMGWEPSEVSKYSERVRKAWEWANEGIAGPQPEGTVGAAITAGAKSAASMAPAYLVALAQPEVGVPLLLSWGALQAGTQASSKAFDKGLRADTALDYAVSDASIEILTELIPAVGVVKDITKGTGLAKSLVGNLSKEIPGEIAASLGQKGTEWLYLNPERSAEDVAGDVPKLLAQTVIATVTASVLTMGLVGSLNTTRKNEAAKANAQKAMDLVDSIQKSETFKRDADTLKGMVQNISGDSTATVGLDELMAVFKQDKGEIIKAFPSVVDQLENVANTELGVELEIPAAEVIVAAAKTGLGKDLLDRVRFAQDLPTALEVIQQEEVQDEALSVMSDTVEPVMSQKKFIEKKTEVPDTDITYTDLDGNAVTANAKAAVAENLTRRDALRKCLG